MLGKRNYLMFFLFLINWNDWFPVQYYFNLIMLCKANIFIVGLRFLLSVRLKLIVEDWNVHDSKLTCIGESLVIGTHEEFTISTHEIWDVEFCFLSLCMPITSDFSVQWYSSGDEFAGASYLFLNLLDQVLLNLT